MKFQHTKVDNCETWFVGFPLLGFVLSFVLINKGYEFKEVYPVDMFPQTFHVESIVCLTKSK